MVPETLNCHVNEAESFLIAFTLYALSKLDMKYLGLDKHGRVLFN